MDLVLRLREFRRMRGLSQREAARMSGIGEKTISSFETGQRIDSLKISQLLRLLKVYGVSEEEFFVTPVEEDLDVWSSDDAMSRNRQQLSRRLEALPTSIQSALISKIQLMIETAEEVQTIATKGRPYTTSDSMEWQMLNSRN